LLSEEGYFLKICPFLGYFAKLQKATIGVVMFVRLSFRPHGTIRLPLEGFNKI
jgi:hypothetical protein